MPKNQLGSSQIVTLGQQYTARGNNPVKGLIYSTYSSVVFKLSYIYNSLFARLGTDYEIRNQWFFAILEAMTTD